MKTARRMRPARAAIHTSTSETTMQTQAEEHNPAAALAEKKRGKQFFIVSAFNFVRHETAGAACKERARLAAKFPDKQFDVFRCRLDLDGSRSGRRAYALEQTIAQAVEMLPPDSDVRALLVEALQA